MNLKFICPRWGSEQLTYETFFKKAIDAGYEGVEFSLPEDEKEMNQVTELIHKTGLSYIAQHWETHHQNFEDHKEAYKKRLHHLAKAHPYFINAHTGKDYFSFEQNAALIAVADNIAQKYGIKIIHETHRGRFSFAAHVTKAFLKELPGLRLTLDLSHWCNVAESYLEDQTEAVALAIERTDHIHARVGFPEGPQIPDPAAPEWAGALEKHVQWWKSVKEIKEKRGDAELSIAPEFGPYPYMQILPYIKKPISNQWDVNVFMMNYLKKVLS